MRKAVNMFGDTSKDVKMQKYINSRAALSLAILGSAFVLHGSGSFLNIRSESEVVKRVKTKKDLH